MPDVPRRSATTLVLAVLALVVVPLVPGALSSGSLTGFVRIPVESLLVLLVLALLPWRPARIAVASIFGAAVVAAILLAAIDRGYESALSIRFDPADGQQLISAFGLVSDALGAPTAIAVVVLVAALAAGTAALLAWSALRVDAGIRRHVRAGTAALTGVATVWIVSALVGTTTTATPVAAAASADAIGSAVSLASAGATAQARLVAQAADDPYARAPASDLLTALRGKDVVFVFIESYGRSAVEGSSFAPGVDAVLRQGTADLAAQGYASESAWMTSPTFGGISWLAHSTLQTGLWIDTQSSYDTIVGTQRFTLSDAFRTAGWRTVSDVPRDTGPWADGVSFYHYGSFLDARNSGYRGPSFGYARIPDQYTLKAFADRELASGHTPVMAEIDLLSSHTPFAPLPQLEPWDAIGDGSVYAGQPAQGDQPAAVWEHTESIRTAYGQAIQYSVGSLLSFLQNVDDPNLVVVALGDHQPSTIVSGSAANHDVPVSIIARDPAVLKPISGWHWQAGLEPGAAAPTWRMDVFRDRFLAAFGPQ
ncbi:CDP-alcohol phosphatidyltransferase [Microbacterium candidum]|uniref:CDP-alcohol phosphatidyltransferase n=1 Tax=Microbacterium candidum TaxID=3041922 RepID=A0ABT7MVD3_9MICO|nr:CDP-alcohol phosphatidyltransferase [Microbacterium sp. ASV49]MDL9978406.1 CDP-alcohol phosphatidyltransferase [Microbacterium sp. ASV49]